MFTVFDILHTIPHPYLARALQSSKKVTLPLWSSSGGRTQCLGLMKGLMKSWGSIVLKIGVWWEMRGRTASRAQCIGEPGTEYLSVNQTSFQVCLPAMATPNQLLRFDARLVPDSGSSPLLHTQAASLYSLPEIAGSGVFKEERFGNLNWSI